MKVLGVIPARYGSTRFPGKSLVTILGKPLLQWVVEGSKESQKITDLIVATDHSEIASLAQKLGVEAVMTSPELPSGSDRVWEAVKDRNVDVIVNIQGDEPLINGVVLDSLIQPFTLNTDLKMATLGRKLDLESLQSVNTAKIILDADDNAIYFSRFPIPYSRNASDGEYSASLKHLGIYAYRKDFLGLFCSCEVAEIEKFEGLEQLRALYLGAKIKVIRTQHDSWGVDTPEDVIKVEKLILERNTCGKS
ncbi:MAG: 3-deoxy-manno-octulosonate cytidylyltransferase [Bdellovibrionaceae bacterium]|nr:3-deoxy-manno-octulosonate cytidylyltransferase [Pseudobdellovibrionaceae bacterium]